METDHIPLAADRAVLARAAVVAVIIALSDLGRVEQAERLVQTERARQD